MGGNCWSRGPESQKASAIWLGGVSAVISASDLDAVTLGEVTWFAYQCSCALPFCAGSAESGNGLPTAERPTVVAGRSGYRGLVWVGDDVVVGVLHRAFTIASWSCCGCELAHVDR